MGTRVIVEHAASSLYVERGGNEGPLLLLIHGLASNGAVWDRLLPLVQRHWSGSYLIPDLRGHGKSPHTRPYSFGHFVTDLAGFVERGRKVAVIGHSLGGVLGALLASGWFGVDVRTVLALSVKTVWTDEELVKFEGVGNQEVRWMESQSDAAARYVKSSGLTGIVEAAWCNAGSHNRMADTALPPISWSMDPPGATLAAFFVKLCAQCTSPRARMTPWRRSSSTSHMTKTHR